jgi:flagellar basal-body rod modification protein FlgD
MSNSIDTGLIGQLGIGPRAAEGPREELGQQDFLKLMLAQLQNQDPFSPMESGEFLGQLAQFGTVSGISEMQKSIEGLAGSLTGNQTLQAASLVSRDVLVPTREGWLPPDGELAGAVDVPAGVRNVFLEITDLNGSPVARLPVDAQVAGQTSFRWNGQLSGGDTAPPGFYEVRAVGESGGNAQDLEVMIAGRVESVALGGAGGSVKLTVTGLGTVDLGRVRGIL